MSSRSGSILSEYSQLKTIPALLSVVFAMTSLYQFGGVSELHLVWLDYTLTTGHAMLASIATYAVAFMSSETRQFENYTSAEQVILGSGLLLVIGHQHIGIISDAISNAGTTGGIVTFLITLLAWGVAVR
jgi:hypothetical protein